MENTKSLWDGWEFQFRCPPKGPTITLDGGAYVVGKHQCALTFIDWSLGYYTVEQTLKRMNARIIAEHPEAAQYRLQPVAYANNVLGWTPEDFRRIDRETQIEAAVKPLLESVSVLLPEESQEKV